VTKNTQALRAAARRRTEQAEQAVTQALRTARRSRESVTITGLAAAAGVSPDFIYTHPRLRAQAEALRRTRRTGPGSACEHSPADAEAAASNLVRALQQQLAQQRRARREEVTELKAALAAALGENLALRRQAAEAGRPSPRLTEDGEREPAAGAAIPAHQA
jgi:Family of unknown function (DUF6262)